jgi:hypothetical protein
VACWRRPPARRWWLGVAAVRPSPRLPSRGSRPPPSRKAPHQARLKCWYMMCWIPRRSRVPRTFLRVGDGGSGLAACLPLSDGLLCYVGGDGRMKNSRQIFGRTSAPLRQLKRWCCERWPGRDHMRSRLWWWRHAWQADPIRAVGRAGHRRCSCYYCFDGYYCFECELRQQFFRVV